MDDVGIHCHWECDITATDFVATLERGQVSSNDPTEEGQGDGMKKKNTKAKNCLGCRGVSSDGNAEPRGSVNQGMTRHDTTRGDTNGRGGRRAYLQRVARSNIE